jgi:hypothetical protein
MHPGPMTHWWAWLAPYTVTASVALIGGVPTIQPILPAGADRWVVVAGVIVLGWLGGRACQALAGWSRRRTSAGLAGP